MQEVNGMNNATTNIAVKERRKNNFLSKLKWVIPVLCIFVIAIVFAVIWGSHPFSEQEEKIEPEIITVQTLEKIIDVSEFSTFTAVYNGIAEVHNEKKPEQIDYYVSYEAYVYAGIDFDKIEITMNETEKIVNVDIPDAYIQNVNVDIKSLDFIFYNKKANTSTITAKAYAACEEDVKKESAEQQNILQYAKQNAVNSIEALITPIIEQLDDDYTLVIE